MLEKQRNRVEAMYDFSVRLQACAERAGLTEAEIRTRMGAKRYYVRNWFRGKCFPRGDAAKLAEILSVSVAYLLRGDGPDPWQGAGGKRGEVARSDAATAAGKADGPVPSAISSAAPATPDWASLHAQLDRLLDAAIATPGAQIQVHLVYPLM